MTRTYDDLVADEKLIVRRQQFDLILNWYARQYQQGLANSPAWLSPAELIVYNDLIDKCRRAAVSTYYFVCRLYADTSIRQSTATEAQRRAAALIYLQPGEELPQQPVTGEETGV